MGKLPLPFEGKGEGSASLSVSSAPSRNLISFQNSASCWPLRWLICPASMLIAPHPETPYITPSFPLNHLTRSLVSPRIA